MDEQTKKEPAARLEDRPPENRENGSEAAPQPHGESGNTDRPMEKDIETGANQTDPPAADAVPDKGFRFLAERLERMETGINALLERVSFLPGQLRNLGGRVDAMAASISESRYQALLKDLLGLHDLVDQLIRSVRAAAGTAADDRLKSYEIIRTQIIQILEYNGLTRIPARGPFNPDLHRAVDRVPCPSEEEAGMIVEKVRDGFKTDHQVLRYAEVVVSCNAPEADD